MTIKQIPAGRIIATEEIVEAVRAEEPSLTDRFRLHDQAFTVPGADGITVTTRVIS